jgi:hypothetical protein
MAPAMAANFSDSSDSAYLLKYASDPKSTPGQLEEVFSAFGDQNQFPTMGRRFLDDLKILDALLKNPRIDLIPNAKKRLMEAFDKTDPRNSSYGSLLTTEDRKKAYELIQAAFSKKEKTTKSSCEDQVPKLRREIASLRARLDSLDPTIHGIDNVKKSVDAIAREIENSQPSGSSIAK